MHEAESIVEDCKHLTLFHHYNTCFFHLKLVPKVYVDPVPFQYNNFHMMIKMQMIRKTQAPHVYNILREDTKAIESGISALSG